MKSQAREPLRIPLSLVVFLLAPLTVFAFKEIDLIDNLFRESMDLLFENFRSGRTE